MIEYKNLNRNWILRRKNCILDRRHKAKDSYGLWHHHESFEKQEEGWLEFGVEYDLMSCVWLYKNLNGNRILKA